MQRTVAPARPGLICHGRTSCRHRVPAAGGLARRARSMWRRDACHAAARSRHPCHHHLPARAAGVPAGPARGPRQRRVQVELVLGLDGSTEFAQVRQGSGQAAFDDAALAAAGRASASPSAMRPAVPRCAAARWRASSSTLPTAAAPRGRRPNLDPEQRAARRTAAAGVSRQLRRGAQRAGARL